MLIILNMKFCRVRLFIVNVVRTSLSLYGKSSLRGRVPYKDLEVLRAFILIVALEKFHIKIINVCCKY